MFEEWKRAWQQAVENFQRELGEGEGSARVRAMRRQLDAARAAMARLEKEIGRTRRDASHEREQETICRRREVQAHGIGDEETVRLAVDYAVRHAEYAVILERKVEILVAERELLSRDLEEMETVLASQSDDGLEEAPQIDVSEARERQDRDFDRLERDARERAAEARLEELKRRMR